eukprot:1185424-Prorocentrum_minimum.AAC.3
MVPRPLARRLRDPGQGRHPTFVTICPAFVNTRPWHLSTRCAYHPFIKDNPAFVIHFFCWTPLQAQNALTGAGRAGGAGSDR